MWDNWGLVHVKNIWDSSRSNNWDIKEISFGILLSKSESKTLLKSLQNTKEDTSEITWVFSQVKCLGLHLISLLARSKNWDIKEISIPIIKIEFETLMKYVQLWDTCEITGSILREISETAFGCNLISDAVQEKLRYKRDLIWDFFYYTFKTSSKTLECF